MTPLVFCSPTRYSTAAEPDPLNNFFCRFVKLSLLFKAFQDNFSRTATERVQYPNPNRKSLRQPNSEMRRRLSKNTCTLNIGTSLEKTRYFRFVPSRSNYARCTTSMDASLNVVFATFAGKALSRPTRPMERTLEHRNSPRQGNAEEPVSILYNCDSVIPRVAEWHFPALIDAISSSAARMTISHRVCEHSRRARALAVTNASRGANNTAANTS